MAIYVKDKLVSSNVDQFTIKQDEPLTAIVARLAMPEILHDYLNVSIDGVVVPKENWQDAIATPKNVVYIAVVPRGDSGGKNPLASIAMLALAVFAPYVGQWAALGPFGTAGGAAIGAATTAGVMFVGALAINALFPPPSVSTPSSEGDSAGFFGLEGLRNQARPHQAVRNIFGTYKVAPDIAAEPYTLTHGDMQTLHAVYDFGYGNINVSNIKIGNTDISEYTNQYVIRKGYTTGPLTYYKNDNVSESFSTEIRDSTVTRTTPSDESDEVFIDINFPIGLCQYPEEGGIRDHPVRFEIYVEKTDGSTGLISMQSLPRVATSHPITYEVPAAPTLTLTNLYTETVVSDPFAYQSCSTVRAATTFTGEVRTATSTAYPSTNPPLVVVGQYFTFNGVVYTFTGVSTPTYTVVTLTEDNGPNTYYRVASYATLTLDKSTVAGACIPYVQQYDWNDGSPRWIYVPSVSSTFLLSSPRSSGFYLRRTTALNFTFSINLVFPSQGEWDIHITRLPGKPSDPTWSWLVIWYEMSQAWDDKYFDRTDLVVIQSVTTNRDPLNFRIPHTILEMSVSATDKISGMVDTLVADCRRELDWYSGGVLQSAQKETSNPAWIALDILMGDVNPDPIPASRIDITAFEAWATFCGDANTADDDYHADCNWDSSSTVFERLLSIMTAGRATISTRENKYSVVYEQFPTVATQMLTTKNSWGFKGTKIFTKQPHAINVSFIDPLSEWQQVDRIVYADGYGYDPSYGSLVTNGTFDTNTDDWASGNAATLSVVSAALRVTATTTAYAYAEQIVTLEVGKAYHFHVDFIGGTGFGKYHLGTETANNYYITSGTATDYQFTAVSTTFVIVLFTSNVVSQYHDFDNVYVGEDATYFENITLPLCTSSDRAWKAGRYYLAQGRLRPESFTVTTDIENLIAERGDLIELEYDVARMGGTSTRITAVQAEGTTLVLNGTFDTNTDDWIAGNSAVLSVVAGKMRVTNGGANYPQAKQEISGLTLGTAYIARGTKYDGTSTCRIDVDIDGVDGAGNLDSGELTFIPSVSTTVTIQLYSLSLSTETGVYAEFDNIVLVEAPKVTLREPVSWAASPDYYLRIRKDDGTQEEIQVLGQDDSYTITLASTPSPVAKIGDLCVYGEENYVTEEFLVKSVTPSTDLTATFNLVPVARAIADADTGTIPDYVPAIAPDIMLYPVCLSAVNVNINLYYDYRYPYVDVTLNWINIGTNVAYEIWLSVDATDNYSLVDIVRDASTYQLYTKKSTLDDDYNYEGDQLIKVIPMNAFGYKPVLNTCSATAFILPHDDTAPGRPLFFSGNIANDVMSFTWLPPDELDIAGYMLKYTPDLTTSDWDNASSVGSIIPYNITSTSVNARVGSYMLKVIDTSGNFSDEFGLVRTTIPSISGFLVQDTLTEDPTFAGIKTNTEVVSSSLRLTSTDDVYQEYGVYNFEDIVDLGDAYRVYVTNAVERVIINDSAIDAREGDQDVIVQVRVSSVSPSIADWDPLSAVTAMDAIGENDWSGWSNFYAGYFTARYLQFRAVLISNKYYITPSVTGLEVVVSLPLRIEQDNDVTCAIGGITVTFDAEFNSIPSIGITMDDTGKNEYYTIANKSVTGFDIEFWDGSGTPVSIAAQFDWIVSGFGEVVSEVVNPIDAGEEDDLSTLATSISTITNTLLL